MTLIRILLVAIPEPIELFASGAALFSGVGLLRWFLERAHTEKTDENVTDN